MTCTKPFHVGIEIFVNLEKDMIHLVYNIVEGEALCGVHYPNKVGSLSLYSGRAFF